MDADLKQTESTRVPRTLRSRSLSKSNEMSQNIIETEEIVKTFPGVKALQDVWIEVERGTVRCHLRGERARASPP